MKRAVVLGQAIGGSIARMLVAGCSEVRGLALCLGLAPDKAALSDTI
jgi:hypothetical protein